MIHIIPTRPMLFIRVPRSCLLDVGFLEITRFQEMEYLIRGHYFIKYKNMNDFMY